MMRRFILSSGLKIATVSFLLLTVVVMAGGNSASADPWTPMQRIERWLGILDETDVSAPVDFGQGPGVGPTLETPTRKFAPAMMVERSQIPSGGAAASITGVFGSAVAWPLNPIHMVLLPDGRVMNYGTSATGAQGARLIYDVWNPSLGTGANAHVTLPNTTKTDIFCGAQAVMQSGDVLTSGGDLLFNGLRNSANNATTIFSPTSNSIAANTPMNYARWYGSLVALPNGQLVIFGGRQNVGALTPAVGATTPELYDPAGKSWTPLTGATNAAAFGIDWYYPRAFVAPGGNIFVVSNTGLLFYTSIAGAGSTTQSKVSAPLGSVGLPTVSFAPGKALSLRANQAVVVIDYRTSTPVVTPTANMDQIRFWASGSIMADGRVLINGGSVVQNELTGVAYQAQIWNPNTGTWTAGAIATKPRLYHSNAMLLADGTVITAGGGAPGPVNNLNAEIYYPPYLYAANGTAAVRPVISSVASTYLNPGDTLSITVGPTDSISRLTFIRTGSATHSYNSDQRFINLTFAQEGQHVTATLPTDITTLVPGFYMVFAFNAAGTPSLASIVQVM
jgi:hypothetical protein